MNVRRLIHAAVIAALHFGLTYGAWYLSVYQFYGIQYLPSQSPYPAPPPDAQYRSSPLLICVAAIALLFFSFPLGWPTFCLQNSWFWSSCAANSVFWAVFLVMLRDPLPDRPAGGNRGHPRNPPPNARLMMGRRK
ncbi:MAG: hypothetical protein ACE5KM_07210 [Planctomycetaceae bacterium]